MTVVSQNSSVVCPAPFQFDPLGHATITVSGVVTLASGVDSFGNPVPIPAAAVMALIGTEVANVRWTDDNKNTPSATFGKLLSSGQDWWYGGSPLGNIKFAAVSGTPVIHVAFYK